MGTQFIQLPTNLISIAESNRFMCFLTYAIIDNQKTQDKTSCISFDKMYSKYGIDKKSSIKAVHTLKEHSFIDYTQVETGRYSNDKPEVYNLYTFPLIKKHEMRFPFVIVDTSVLNLELSTKERGVLLGLHLLKTDTEELPYNDERLAELLGITLKTMRKHIKMLLETGLLIKTRIGYKL